MGVAENISDLRSLLGVVAEETGALKLSDADEDSVGWTTEGPLPMTFGHVRRAHAALAALEAALSAAERQPAPSVAVKALRWKGPDSYGEYHSLDGLWGYIIRAGNGNGFWLTEIGDYFPSPEAAQAAAQSDYEACIRSALSAQVQDVAGWQSMDTAPKDGKHCLLAVKVGPFVYAVQGAYSMGEWGNAADIHSKPLCWMPLTRIPPVYLPWTDEFAAAAPAKQEG